MINTRWCDYHKVAKLGRYLIDTDQIDNMEDLQYYYEKPWKWTNEYYKAVKENFETKP